MRIPLPSDKQVADASTYQLLLWWCLCPVEPDEAMEVEVEMQRRLREDPAHVEAICAATGLEFDGTPA